MKVLLSFLLRKYKHYIYILVFLLTLFRIIVVVRKCFICCFGYVGSDFLMIVFCGYRKIVLGKC